MSTDTTTKPAIDERLANAVSSSNLSPQRDSTLPLNTLDLITAAGWTKGTASLVLGRALLAVEAEWDASEQPRAPREHDILALISTMPMQVDMTDDEGKPVLDAVGRPRQVHTTAKQRNAMGRAQAAEWYEKERVRIIGRMRTLPLAQHALAAWATQRSIRDPEAKALALLAWWLDHRCPKCLGTMLDPVSVGGRGSCRVCTLCQGLGERPLPFDDRYTQDGRLMERGMIEARHDAMKKIRGFMSRGEHHA